MPKRHTLYKAMCNDCPESRIMSFRLEANRNSWAEGHRKLTSRLPDGQHFVKTYEWVEQS